MFKIKFQFDYGADSCLWDTEGEGLLLMERLPISEALIEKARGGGCPNGIYKGQPRAFSNGTP